MMGLMAGEETRTMTPPTVRSSAACDAREPGGTSTRAWTMRLLVIGIVLSALNLRPAITSLGALLEEVRDGLGMSGSVAGLLTSVPSLCFAVFGVMAPRHTTAPAASERAPWCAPAWPPSPPAC
jgi:CP family cyanate transporter-like MFS transporter